VLTVVALVAVRIAVALIAVCMITYQSIYSSFTGCSAVIKTAEIVLICLQISFTVYTAECTRKQDDELHVSSIAMRLKYTVHARTLYEQALARGRIVAVMLCYFHCYS
jgi:hypothetical protein